MKPEVQANKIVVLSGAGLSAESGLPTFRDGNGLWNGHSWRELASPKGWARNPEAVLAFYNERRRQAWQAEPNAAHMAIAALQAAFDVVVVTQNVDELHERAGSRNVIHLHGQLAYARGTAANSPRRYRIEDAPIALGQCCEDGTQLRPDVVWFGEEVPHLTEARRHIASAAKVLVAGTSLTVYPAAGLLNAARGRAEKVLVALDEVRKRPYGFEFLRGRATVAVPRLVSLWLNNALGDFEQYGLDWPELVAAYPDQFGSPRLRVEPLAAWQPVFAGLCMAVDALPENAGKRVQWVQVKEKLGSLRARAMLTVAMDAPGAKVLREKVTALCEKARAISEVKCEWCGAIGAMPDRRYGVPSCEPVLCPVCRVAHGPEETFHSSIERRMEAERARIDQALAQTHPPDGLTADSSATGFDLERFVEAQISMYAVALEELRHGKKQSHWVWFIFPILRGLRPSAQSHRYGICSLAEARAYAGDAVLGPRLVECVQALLAHGELPVASILGAVDAAKLQACLTLFARAAPTEPVFHEALVRFYAGTPDAATLGLLGRQ